jgi:type II secretory pathway predicted ATPase ExeA
MYEPFYGFREAPFELTANPAYLFLTDHHSEALANLEYGLSVAKPITVLIGEAGTGKSTLLRAAMTSDMCRHVTCLYLENPTLTRAEFFEVLAARLGLPPDAPRSKASLLAELESIARDRQTRQGITALVIDEAQALSDELLEEIRLLANIETPTSKLLPVVLAGQVEFAERLNDPRLRQLKQRIALRCELRRLDLSETAAYIASRIRTAGGDPARLFTREAVSLVHEYSHGVPRTISVICDNALMSGFALARKPIDGDLVREVCRDFDLRPAADPNRLRACPSPSSAEPPRRAADRDDGGLAPDGGDGTRAADDTQRRSMFALRGAVMI